MFLKRSVAILILFFLALSIPSISSQTKNRVAVSEAGRIKLFEYNDSNQKFDIVWESADISLNSRMGTSMRDLHIVDINDDGNPELVGIDQYGIFIWGKNGKYPQYFPLQGLMITSRNNYISFVDIDGDSKKEILTQQMRRAREKRLITVWKIDSNQLFPQNEIELPGTASWSLRHGDFDGDGETEILTSANLIHILGWKDGEGLVIEAEIANVAQLVDVARPADINGDGVDEIIASGSSGCFSVYKHRKIHGMDYYPLYFQSLIMPRDMHSNSQGLHFADIVGDGAKEILIGMTSRKSENDDNILVYKKLQSSSQRGSAFQFEKVFSMPQMFSNIPGFVIGDLDNDGQNEVIYNNRFVLKFHNDVDGKMSCESMREISQRANSAAIGPFYPSGEDKPDGLRLNPMAVAVDLKGGEFIESNKAYEITVKLKSSWHDVRQICVGLESESDAVEIEPGSVSFDAINAGQEVENTEQPFVLRTKYVGKQTPFELKLVIETESGFRMEQKGMSLQSKSNNSIFNFIQPKLLKNSKTIAISSGEGIYEGLDIKPEYFNDYHGIYWPLTDDLNSYKNLIWYDEVYSLPEHIEKLKSFLDKGGNCLMQSYYLISLMEDPIPPYLKESADFITSYVHIRSLDETDQSNGIKGQTGDVITDGLSFDITIGEVGDLPGILEPLASAVPILFYPDGKVAGVRIDGPYKMVILPFYLNDIESVEVRKILLQRILDWFDQE